MGGCCGLCRVHVAIWAIHHDPKLWPDPSAFRPERFLDPEQVAARHPGAFLAFGLGPRNCVGECSAICISCVRLV